MTNILDRALLHEAIRRAVQMTHPKKIILFRSPAQGQIGPHRDLDLLAVGSGGENLDFKGNTHPNLHGVEATVDAIGAFPDSREANRHSYGMAMQEASREGRVVYDTE